MTRVQINYKVNALSFGSLNRLPGGLLMRGRSSTYARVVCGLLESLVQAFRTSTSPTLVSVTHLMVVRIVSYMSRPSFTSEITHSHRLRLPRRILLMLIRYKKEWRHRQTPLYIDSVQRVPSSRTSIKETRPRTDAAEVELEGPLPDRRAPGTT